MSETHHTFCRICEALCGLQVRVVDGRVQEIRPDDDHVATEGFGCFKGIKQHLLYDSPDRVRRPQKRVGERWSEIPWEQALGEIGAKVARLRRDHGPDSIGMYVGTAAGFGVLHPIFAQGFMTGLGSRSMYASATQDCANKFAVAREMYGFPFLQPFPDVAHVECLVIVGANPAVSKWSFLQVPNPVKRLREIQARGGRVIVVDPRRTETAKAASQHVFIRPGTDVFFLLAFLRELVATGGVDRARVDRHTSGFSALEDLVAPWTAERVAEVTRIPPDTLRAIVAAYRSADGAALYSSTGVNMGGYGALAFWIQEAINAASGNLDRRGGTLVGQGIFDFPRLAARGGALMRDDRSRIGGFRSVNDAFPGGVLADEISTPGPGQLRAMFVTGGNPLITMANAGRLRAAFAELELLVTLDIFRNETGSLAHYVLPTTSPLQRPDLPFVFPLFLGMQSKPYLQATRAVIPPEGEQRDEATIYLDLCRASGVNLFGSAIAQRSLEVLRSLATARRRLAGEQVSAEIPQELLLSLLLRATGNGSFSQLLRDVHGRARPGHAPGSFLTGRILTPDGRVNLAPPVLVADAAARLEPAFEREKASAGRLKLITRRHVKTHNSWTHNHESFVAGDHDRNHLYVHPDDAAALGLRDDALADVATKTATVRLPVRVDSDLMPGTVAMPHGWGHQHATGIGVAASTAGVNVNLLAADGVEQIEPVSGMSHLTGIPVEVRPAAGPVARDWSGIAPA